MNPTIQPILTNSPEIPHVPKVTFLDWVKYYIYNWFRKPLVWKRKRDLEKISYDIKLSLSRDVLTYLWVRKGTCRDCIEAYMALKPQIYLSQISLILRTMRCAEHPAVFDTFLHKHKVSFSKSESIARWINGF